MRTDAQQVFRATEDAEKAVHMMKQLPVELLTRCDRIEEEANQGVPLTASDWVWFVLVTLVLPLVLIVLGVVLW